MRWLKLAEQSFEFWDNDEDGVYDRLVFDSHGYCHVRIGRNSRPAGGISFE